MLKGLKAILVWGWSPIVITAVAVAYIYEWPVEWQIEIIVSLLIVILIIGLVVMIVRAREQQQELKSQKLKQLAGYFNQRFMGNSSLSIFTIINSLFKVDNPQIWDWARACDMAQRVFNTWCTNFVIRLESDNRTGKFNEYLRQYLNELWQVNNHYYEFIEQFCEIAQKIEIPQETREQYNRFIVEYNTFVGNFQENIAELKRTARTEIEPPSVKLAKELPVVVQSAAVKAETRTSPPADNRGYYLQ